VGQKVALITGITGQDGSYLTELLLSKNYIVHGIKRRASSFNTQRLDHLNIYEDKNRDSPVFLHYGDLVDSNSLISIISKSMPDEIYNLAAQSHVQVSFDNPVYTSDVNAMGTLRILEAIRVLNLETKTKVYQASTSEMFGMSSSSMLSENSPFYPRSPYGISKLFAYWAIINYRESYNMFSANGILFNHESPRRGDTFVTKKIVRGALRIKHGLGRDLQLGNLDAVRDWGHAKDYANGMWKILQHKTPEDWVLATGISMSVREFVEIVFDNLGMPLVWNGSGVNEQGLDNNGKALIAINERHLRPAEVPHLLGNAEKARSLLNWHPEISVQELISEMIEEEEKTLLYDS
jgi:GDPmannose 4,6-dehydratase